MRRTLPAICAVAGIFGVGFGFGLQLTVGESSSPKPRPVAAVAPPVTPGPTTEAALRASAVTTADVQRFVPLYRRAARRFGVDWLLLASIHAQETAFSTAPGTYRGLNFARCCAGPMQFNVKNGKPSTWERFRDAYKLAQRPAAYPHATPTHPSVYDDFDSIMAAAKLLRANGAGAELDGAAWSASYQYYGPGDVAAVDYANDVLARATAWRAHGFDAGRPLDPALVATFEADYGAAIRAQLAAAAPDEDEPGERRRSRGGDHEPKARERAEPRPRPRSRPRPPAHQQPEPDSDEPSTTKPLPEARPTNSAQAEEAREGPAETP